MGVWLDIVLLAAGLALLLCGGEWLVRGAAGLARDLGVAPVIIGLTIVAFGTSAPELAVNVDAAVRGQPALSFGNIIGSNIANIGLILAVGALIRPLEIVGTVVPREIPMMLLGSFAVLIMGFDSLTSGGTERDVYDRSDGLLLLLIFCVFVYTNTRDALKQRAESSDVLDERLEKGTSRALRFVLVVIGGAGLWGGAEMTVHHAIRIATHLGVSDVTIGLTVIAFGTSLPELAATVAAGRRGEAAIAVGNIVGSNIFNLLFVMGITAVIADIPVPEGGFTDLIVVTTLSIVMLWFSLGRVRRIVRLEGVVLLTTYLAYLAYRVL